MGELKCFLCIDNCYEDSKYTPSEISRMLRALARYVKLSINIGDEAEDNISLTLCGECQNIMDTFMELLKAFEAARMKVDSCVQKICDIMLEGNRCEVESEIKKMGTFRKNLIDKTSLEIEKSQPTVEITRVYSLASSKMPVQQIKKDEKTDQKGISRRRTTPKIDLIMPVLSATPQPTSGANSTGNDRFDLKPDLHLLVANTLVDQPELKNNQNQRRKNRLPTKQNSNISKSRNSLNQPNIKSNQNSRKRSHNKKSRKGSLCRPKSKENSGENLKDRKYYFIVKKIERLENGKRRYYMYCLRCQKEVAHSNEHRRKYHKDAYVPPQRPQPKKKSQSSLNSLPDFITDIGTIFKYGIHQILFHCSLCNYDFPRQNLHKHKKKHGIGLDKCSTCHKEFKERHAFLKHIDGECSSEVSQLIKNHK